MDNKITIQSENFKKVLATQYLKQINNFFANDKQAMKFLSAVMASVQRTPELLNCRQDTLINSFITMAQLGLMPSDVSGEAFVLPYKGIAQFQLGYQGLITLFYRAGGQKIRAEIVRENDDFSYVNGEIKHTIDIMKSNKDRGKPVGAYAIATVGGEEIAKIMNAEDILSFGAKFSKSFKSSFTPWNVENDPELWMWKKTVLKQLAKMLPKNETISKAIALDNQDSIISDRVKEATAQSSALKIGSSLLSAPASEETKVNIVPEQETEEDFVKEVEELMEK